MQIKSRTKGTILQRYKTGDPVSGPIEINNFDIDIHILNSEGKRIGMDYSTGIYYGEIEGFYSNGNIRGGGYEWISIPSNIDV